MNTEKVIFRLEKTIEQCRQCPNCRISPDPDPEDWFNDDDEAAYCTAVKGEDDRPKLVEGALRPYEKVYIPEWCPLRK